jgi:hypothetical protein
MTNQALTKNFPLRLSAADHARLLEAAASCRTNASTLLRQLLCDYLDGTSLAPAAPKPAQPTPATTPAPVPKPVAAPKPKPNPGPMLLGPKGFAPGTDLFRAAFYWHLDNLGLLSAAPHDIAAKYQIPEAIITATISYGLNNRGLRHIDVPEHTVDGITFPARQGMVPMTAREQMICRREGGECMPEDPPEAFELQPEEPTPAHAAPTRANPDAVATLDSLFDD